MEFYAIARSDKYFKDPLEFKPERWIRESKDVHSFSHLQFGFGPRMCVGKKRRKKNHNEVVCADHALLKNLKRVTVISLVTQLWPPTQRFLGVRQALQTPPKNLRVGGY